jgi:hypothetical protein
MTRYSVSGVAKHFVCAKICTADEYIAFIDTAGIRCTTTCECYKVRRSHLVSLLTPDQAIGVPRGLFGGQENFNYR